MLNALRLKDGFNLNILKQQTYLDSNEIAEKINSGISKRLLEKTNNHIKPTTKGYLFLNDCVNLFV